MSQIMSPIQLIGSPPLWNSSQIVGHQNCKRSGQLRILRGSELDRPLSAVILRGLVTGFCWYPHPHHPEMLLFVTLRKNL